ncbi:MAG: hypothetical protein MUE54_11835 [Anaerolineae bacterium]|jgi:hypothetical protein|nr:hypothetical protein [Anaerolineae bacterium]
MGLNQPNNNRARVEQYLQNLESRVDELENTLKICLARLERLEKRKKREDSRESIEDDRKLFNPRSMLLGLFALAVIVVFAIILLIRLGAG